MQSKKMDRYTSMLLEGYAYRRNDMCTDDECKMSKGYEKEKNIKEDILQDYVQ